MAGNKDIFHGAKDSASGGAGSDPSKPSLNDRIPATGRTIGEVIQSGTVKPDIEATKDNITEHFAEHAAVVNYNTSVGKPDSPVKREDGVFMHPVTSQELPSDTKDIAWKGVDGYKGTPRSEALQVKAIREEADRRRAGAAEVRDANPVDVPVRNDDTPARVRRNPLNDPFKPARKDLTIKPLSKRKPKTGKPRTIVSAVGTAGKKEVKETTLGTAGILENQAKPTEKTPVNPATVPGTPEFKEAAERSANLEATITGLKTGDIKPVGERGASMEDDPNIIQGNASSGRPSGGARPIVRGVQITLNTDGSLSLPHKEIDPYTGSTNPLTDSQRAENERHQDAFKELEKQRNAAKGAFEHVGSGFDDAITDETHKQGIAKRIAQLAGVKGAMSPAREGSAPRDFMRPRPSELASSMREHLNILKSHASTATGNAGRIGIANTHLKNAQDSLDTFDSYTSNRARGGHEHLVAAAVSLGRANDTLNNLGANRDTGEIQQGTTSIPASTFVNNHLVASSIHGYHSPKAEGTAGSYDLTGTLKDGRTAKVTVKPGTDGAKQVANNIEEMQRSGQITGILKEQLDQMRGLIKTGKTPESEFKRAENQQRASILGDHYKTLLDHMVESSKKTQTVMTPGGDRISEERPVTISGEAATHHTNAKLHLQAANSALYAFSQSKGLGDNKALEKAHKSILAAHAELSHPSLSEHIGVLPISAEKMTESYMAPRENLTLPAVDRGSGGRKSGELMAGRSTAQEVREGVQPQGNMETPLLEVSRGSGIAVPSIMKPVGKDRGVESAETEDPKLVELREGLRGAIKKGDSNLAKTFRDTLMAHKMVKDYQEVSAKPISDEDYIPSDELEGPEKAGK
jgi:hypothetical protein